MGTCGATIARVCAGPWIENCAHQFGVNCSILDSDLKPLLSRAIESFLWPVGARPSIGKTRPASVKQCRRFPVAGPSGIRLRMPFTPSDLLCSRSLGARLTMS